MCVSVKWTLTDKPAIALPEKKLAGFHLLTGILPGGRAIACDSKSCFEYRYSEGLLGLNRQWKWTGYSAALYKGYVHFSLHGGLFTITKIHLSIVFKLINSLSKVLNFVPPRYDRAHDFHPDVGLVVAGGVSGGTTLNKAVISTDHGKTFRNLARLTRPLKVACLVIINGTTFFIAGGQGGGGKRTDEHFHNVCTHPEYFQDIIRKRATC